MAQSATNGATRTHMDHMHSLTHFTSTQLQPHGAKHQLSYYFSVHAGSFRVSVIHQTHGLQDLQRAYVIILVHVYIPHPLFVDIVPYLFCIIVIIMSSAKSLVLITDSAHLKCIYYHHHLWNLGHSLEKSISCLSVYLFHPLPHSTFYPSRVTHWKNGTILLASFSACLKP